MYIIYICHIIVYIRCKIEICRVLINAIVTKSWKIFNCSIQKEISGINPLDVSKCWTYNIRCSLIFKIQKLDWKAKTQSTRVFTPLAPQARFSELDKHLSLSVVPPRSAETLFLAEKSHGKHAGVLHESPGTGLKLCCCFVDRMIRFCMEMMYILWHALATGVGIVQRFRFGKSAFLGPDQNGSPWRGFRKPFICMSRWKR